jgi:DNA-binding transcriptional ArsR family regulator
MSSAPRLDAAPAAAVFKVLGNPARIRALGAIAFNGEYSAKRLSDEMEDATLSLWAYHIRELARAGLIEPSAVLPRRGVLEHFYRITNLGLRAYAVAVVLGRMMSHGK